MKVMALLHPAAVVRGLWPLEPCQEVYLRRLKDHDLNPPVVDVTQPPPGSLPLPTIEQVEAWTEGVLGGSNWALSIDLETCGDHIICTGMTPIEVGGELGPSLCLHFRQRGGDPYWRWSHHLRATECLWRLLASPLAKVFHNGVTFDVPILYTNGFTEVGGRLIDTLGLQHTAWSEMPKGLQFCATLYNGTGVWKRLVEPDDDVEGKT